MRSGSAWIAAAFLLFAACTVAGEDSTPARTCTALAEAACAKLVECHSPETLASAGVPASPEECAAATSTELECESRTEETACPTGLAYDAVMASACLAETAALTCEQVTGRLKDHTPSCSEVCR
jgi:hypothetical protein